MTVLLFGVSNVGKTVTGELLAQKLNYDFYDLDEEIKKLYHTTLEIFVSAGTLKERDKKRCRLLRSLIKKAENKVIAVTPLSYAGSIVPLITSPDVFSVELLDSPENIFERLVFSDENDVLYHDDDYKNKRKDYYLNEIKEDIHWYGSVYSNIHNKFYMDGRTPQEVVDALIWEYHFKDADDSMSHIY